MRYVFDYKLFEEYFSGEDMTLKAGTLLFHATGEEFEPTALSGGGFDGMVWTTTQPGIAQTYIPESGVTIFISLEHIAFPNQDPVIQKLQKRIGIEYDYSEVVWQRDKRHTESYRSAPVFSNMDTDSYSEERRQMFKYVEGKLKSEFGYEPYMTDSSGDHSYKLKETGREIMPSNYRMKGRLFVIKPKQDLKIYDMTEGGRREPDLTDKDYYKLDLFEKLEKEGYDGVKITDFAQTKEYGNLGHLSIGLFKRGLKKCEWEVVPDVTHPDDLEKMMSSGNWDTKEYKMFKKLVDVK